PPQGETIPWGKAKAEKLVTPLARVIAAKGKEKDALLDAAIVRNLAGGDDLKSPRAAGELGAVPQGEDIDADRIAMAGWVSSSGANKTGRLYTARKLALEKNDHATAGFIERRLVDAHIDTDMADWAIAQLRGAKLDTQKDPEALLLAART